MQIRSIYDGLQDKISQETGLACPQKAEDLTDEQVGQELVTRQADRDSTDINLIVAKYERNGGSLADLIQAGAVDALGMSYGDFSEPLDFQAAQNLIVHANEQFDALPVKVRNRFRNDPKEFLAFASDPDNLEEMRKLGLAKPKEDPGQTPPSQPAPGSSGTSPASGGQTTDTKAQA